MTIFENYDKSVIADPASYVQAALDASDDQCRSLIITDCFDLEDGEEPLFHEAMQQIEVEFKQVLQRLTSTFGAPSFSGSSDDKRFPFWAGTGTRVAYWKQERIIYLHITHIGSVAPIELNLGVIKGPPKQWAVGI